MYVRPIFLMLLFFLAVGAFIRLAGGYALILPNLTYSSGSPHVLPGTETPEDTARSFYIFLDQGNYEHAWDISIEPDWIGNAPVAYKTEVVPSLATFAGWTNKTTFMTRLNRELGVNGIWLKLNNLQAQRLDRQVDGFAQELVERLDPEDVYVVRVRGHLLGACSIFQWEKEVPVIKIGGAYKVLLAGTKKAKTLFYQSWFTNIERIGDLKHGGV
jgi:hypothetical protein